MRLLPARPFAEGDYFYVTFDAYDLDGEVIATTNYYLADFRDGRTFIQTNWVELDLSWMPPEVASLVGTMTTSDVGQYGPNTPMYFALADFTYGYSDGSDGVASTNPAILCWADGWTNYLPGTNVLEKWKTPSNALGAAQGIWGIGRHQRHCYFGRWRKHYAELSGSDCGWPRRGFCRL